MQAPEASSGSRKQDLLRQALKRRTPLDRAAFLDEGCGGDAALRVEMEAWLAAALDAGAGNAPLGEGTTEITPTLLDQIPMTEGPGTVIGRYKLLEQIGEGGFGVVYMAEQAEPVKRRVALKVIKLGMDTKQVVARFEAERQSLALMDHPNIAKVFDAGTTQTGRPYFVMELVRGIRINDYCDQNQLSTQQRLKLFILVCQAVQHAHQKGIIHRDIKPSNILVTLHDGVPLPKVIDFGIAKATAGQTLTDKTLFTAFEQFIGTPAYMSPEQAEMSVLDIDTRSDIYSLGVLLYELLAGSTPFDAKVLLASGIDAMRKTIREKEPVRPSTRLATLPGEELTTTAKRRSSDAPKLIHLLEGDLDWIVMKCLEKDRTRRYDTANGLAADLKRFLDNEPVMARPPSNLYRFQKLVRRNKLAFAAVAAVAAALVIGLGLSTWQFIEKSRAYERTAAAVRESRHLLYVANMNLVQAAWDWNNVERVRQLLNETATNNERGFEWYFWQRRSHPPREIIRLDRPGMSFLAISPDGRRAVGSRDGETPRVWDLASGKEILSLEWGNAPIVVITLNYSPDGQRIVAGCEDNYRFTNRAAIIWDSANGRKLCIASYPAHNFRAVSLSPDNRRLVAGFSSSVAKVFDAVSGRRLLSLSGNPAYVRSVAFSPNGQRIVTGCANGTAKLWDSASGRDLLTLKGGGAEISSVAFSPDSQLLVLGAVDGTTEVWRVSSGERLFTLRGHSFSINSIAFSPDGRRILTGGADGTARVWEASSGKEILALKGQGLAISSAVFSSDGQRILTGGWDGTVKAWDAAFGDGSVTLARYSQGVYSAAFSPDGRRVVTGGGGFESGGDPTVRVWDAASGEELLSLDGLTNWVLTAAYSPDGQWIATSAASATSAEGTKLWDATSGKQLLTLCTNQAWAIAFSPDGRRLALGGDGTSTVWDLASRKEIFSLTGTGYGVAFSPDGRRLVTGSGKDRQTARVWDAASGKGLLTLRGHTDEVNAVAFSPDGKRVATGSDDKTARVWDAASGKELLTLKGHVGGLLCVCFSPDGQRVLTGGGDCAVKLWDAASGKELLTLAGHTHAVRSVAFSPDGHRILTASLDYTARIWPAADPQQLDAWGKEEKVEAAGFEVWKREQAENESKAAARAEALKQEKAAARALRIQAPGAIKEWLVLAPIRFEGRVNDESGALALGQQEVPQEASLHPRSAERVALGQRELFWRAAHLEDYVLDFNQFLGKPAEWSVGYAVCYIQSEAERAGLRLKVGSDDEAKIYLNGKEIYRTEDARPYVPDQDVVEGVELKAGLNVLVFKVVKEAGAWQASLRLTDAQGNPVKGIKATLDPEAKE